MQTVWVKSGNRGGGLLSNTDKICGNYCGVSCVDGSCPIANADRYAEYEMDVIRRCEDCWMRRGCEDCVFEGSEYCDGSG